MPIVSSNWCCLSICGKTCGKRRGGEDKRGDIEKLEVPCNRCRVFGSSHFCNHRSCGHSLGSRLGRTLKDCRGNQCDGQQDGNQAVPQPSFVWFLYHKYFSLLVYFFCLYIFYNIYIWFAKNIHTTKHGGVYMHSCIISLKNRRLSNWLLTFYC